MCDCRISVVHLLPEVRKIALLTLSGDYIVLGKNCLAVCEKSHGFIVIHT